MFNEKCLLIEDIHPYWRFTKPIAGENPNFDYLPNLLLNTQDSETVKTQN